MNKLFLIACLFVCGTAAAETKILAIAGSTREGSYNKILVSQAAKVASQMGAKVTVVDLKDYPMDFYDGDLEAKQGMPLNAKKLRQMMIDSDAIIIATPEYNGSISAVLKNAIDWVSRSETGSYANDAFSGKKFALLSASPGASGGARGLQHLRAIIEGVGGKVIAVGVSVPQAHEAFDAAGQLKNPQLRESLKKEIQQLTAR